MKRILVLIFLWNALCFSQQENFEQPDELFESLSSKDKAMGVIIRFTMTNNTLLFNDQTEKPKLFTKK